MNVGGSVVPVTEDAWRRDRIIAVRVPIFGMSLLPVFVAGWPGEIGCGRMADGEATIVTCRSKAEGPFAGSGGRTPTTECR